MPVVTASEDNTARLWDAAAGKEIAVLRGHENSVWSAAFSPDGTRVVTASEDNTARSTCASRAVTTAFRPGRRGRLGGKTVGKREEPCACAS